MTSTPTRYAAPPKSKAFAAFLAKEAARLDGYSIDLDGVWIYAADPWRADDGSATFRADSEAAAVRDFYARVCEYDAETDTLSAPRG